MKRINNDTAVGVNVFTSFVTEKGYKIALHKRSNKVAEYPALFHVCPAGTFQPLSCFDIDQVKQQYSLAYIIMREFVEEFFDKEDVGTDIVPDPFAIFETIKDIISDNEVFRLK